ncbi:MAG TPA: DUF4390 domain-containing protein [Sutterella sp.]|nr:DUF4390 domain-containing protein [Sutterella sp.]
MIELRSLKVAALTLVTFAGTVFAQDAAVMRASLATASAGEPQGLYLSVAVDFDFPRNLEEALMHGTALYFKYEFRLAKQRWYWFDKDAGSNDITLRLSYSPLTRQFRLSQGGLSLRFDTLRDALEALKVLSNWRVLDQAGLSSASGYEAKVRFRLDTKKFPLPLQVNIGTEDWELKSEWTDIRLDSKAVKEP